MRNYELSTAEWETLRVRINQAAELPLARRRTRAARSRRAALLRFAVPLATAAALLLVIRPGVRQVPTTHRLTTPELTTTEQLLLQDMPEREFTAIVSGAQQAKTLLLVAARAK